MKIRKAKLTDIKDIAYVQVKSWKTTYPGLLPDKVIKSRTVESRTRKLTEFWQDLETSTTRCVFVAETNDGKIVGFVCGGKTFDKNLPYQGEVYSIYIIKEYQSKGLGTTLMKEAVKFLVNLGFKTMIVWVLEGNEQASQFYEKLGGFLKERKMHDYGGQEFPINGYVWDDISKILLDV
ncbi:MAG: GNAT family N-acetyltransferase [Candidatus Thorarchaeota archaeon]